MKQVYILRHAPKDNYGELTEEGRTKAEELKEKLPKFDMIIASDSPRTQETATLLTGMNPTIDTRAGFFNAPKKISDAINHPAKTHPSGFTGAYLANNEIKENVKTQVEDFVNLVYETLGKLDPDGKALIISHDITMVPAEKIFTKEFDTKSFNYLGGYIIDENKGFTPYSL